MGEKYLCLECEADLPYTRYSLRMRNPMADKFNGQIQKHLKEFESYSYASALYFYHEGYKEISKGLKYEGRLALGREFGRRLGQDLAASSLFKDVDAVVPVPLHWTRKYKRGYNQADVIAAEVAGVLGAPLGRSFLRRVRRTRSQADLTTEAKAANVAGAFRVTSSGKAISQKGIRHILLVDDVFTTGSTLAACHAALREAFGPAVRISAATLACAAD